MPEAKSLEDLMRIRANNREFLESISHNLGTALGFKKRTGQPLSKQPAILVFVPQKINPKWIPEGQMIPEKLEGPDGLMVCTGCSGRRQGKNRRRSSTGRR